MFSSDELDAIKQQALRQAALARTDPLPLLPVVVSAWPFQLTADDEQFLRSLPYPISPL